MCLYVLAWITQSAADIVGCVIMSETSVVNIIDSWNAGYGTGRDYIQVWS